MREAQQAEVGERLHDVAVSVDGDVLMCGVTRPGGREPERPDPLEQRVLADLDPLAPVQRPAAAERSEP